MENELISIICPECRKVVDWKDPRPDTGHFGVCPYCLEDLEGFEYATEKEIQNAILRLYGTRFDMRLWRANAGAATAADPATGKRRLIKFGLPGQADLSGIGPGGIRVEIEVKDYRGSQSKRQAKFERMVKRFGGRYILARCPQDVYNGLKDLLKG